MDVPPLRLRAICLAALLATTGPLLAAGPAPAATGLELQADRLHALTALADAASAGNVPDDDTLVTAMMMTMDIADPALVPPGSAGLDAMLDLLAACRNGRRAAEQVVRLAMATPDPNATLGRISVAIDRTAIMTTACTARQMDMQSREILKRGVSSSDAVQLEDMRQMAESLPIRIGMLAMGATLTDLNPKSRARTEADALPILREAGAAMTPSMRQAVLDGVEKTLKDADSKGRIDRAARARLQAAVQDAGCTASCQLLSAPLPATP